MKWHLKHPPMTVQSRALQLSEGRRGFNYWMEVGLGKTSTCLNEWMEDYDKGVANFHIVVALNSFKQSWVDEAEFMGAPTAYTVWDKPHDVATLLSKKIGLVINWEALIGSGGDAIFGIMEKRKVRIDFDEAHRIKTPTSQVSKRVVEMWKDTAKRRGLTGTPMDNTVMDMYIPLKLGEQLNGGNPYSFKARYAKVGGFMGKKVVGINEERLPELIAIRDKAGFVATKKDWLTDLPEQRWTTIKMPMHPKLAPHYKNMAQEFYTMLEDGNEITAELVITQLLRLQQISSGFVRVEGVDTPLVPIKQNPKYKGVLDLLESRGGSKLLVFTHFSWTTNELYKALAEELGPSAVTVMRGSGKLHPQENAEEKRRFNESSQASVMVAQATVASESHTLLGRKDMRCHGSVFWENSHVLRTRKQAEGRNHRKGQDLPVDYYDFVASPIEAKVIYALQKKLDLVTQVMSLRGT